MIKRTGIIFIGLVCLVSCQTNELKNSKTEEPVVPPISNIKHPESRIQALVTQLGSDDWRTREKATQELIKMGESIMPELEKVYHSTDDPEVKHRLKQIADEHGYILDPKLREQVNQWLKQLYSADAEKRVEAFDKLIESGRGGIKALKQVLETPPPKIEVALVADKSTIRMGEKTNLKFVVKNTGKKPVLITQTFSRGSSGCSNILQPGGFMTGGRGGWARSICGGQPLTGYSYIRALLKRLTPLKSGESVEIPALGNFGKSSEFSKPEVGIYSYSASQSKRFRVEEFSDVGIKMRNLITSVSGSATICVLPKDEDLGKGLRIEVKNEVKEEVKVNASFAEELKPSEDDDKFGLWYILLDNQLNPISYSNLSKEVRLPESLAGSKVSLSIKCEAKPGEYQILVGYGNCAFSQLEKIKVITKEEDDK